MVSLSSFLCHILYFCDSAYKIEVLLRFVLTPSSVLLSLTAHQSNQCQTKLGKGIGGALCVFPWKYGDDETEYKGCADPSNAGYLWCPTELDDKGKYISGK